MQAYESYKSSLQTEFTMSHTPRDKVRRYHYCRPQSYPRRRRIAQQSQVCNCCPRFGHSIWIQSYPCKTTTSRRKSKGFLHRRFIGIWKKLVKIFNGTIVRLHVIGRRLTEMQKEQYEESKRALRQLLLQSGPNEQW